MLLPLPMKIGEVGHGQHSRAAARRAAEQRGLKPVIVPIGPKRLRDLGSFSPLQVLVCLAPCGGVAASCSISVGAAPGRRNGPRAPPTRPPHDGRPMFISKAPINI